MRRLNKKRGFTLIELLVVLVIMSLVTLAFLNNQAKFDSSTIMRSLAYSIALSVRQAQVYGVSVRSSTGNFAVAHGLHFTNGQSYTLFADNDRNNQYVIPPDKTDQAFTINNEYQITEACAVTTTSLKRCTAGADDSSGPSGSGTVNSLDIVFVRPNPDANIYAYNINGSRLVDPGTGVFDVYTKAYVQLKALNSGDKRFILISNTGQVTVCAPTATLGGSTC